MSAARQVLVNPAGGPLVVDPDPNATAPAASRLFQIPRPSQTEGIWLGALGGPATVALWVFEPNLKRWLRQTFGGAATFALTADNLTNLGLGSFVWGVDAFVQVTVAGGATHVLLGTLLQ